MVTVKVRSLRGYGKGNNKYGIMIDCTSKFRKLVGGEVLYRTCFSRPLSGFPYEQFNGKSRTCTPSSCESNDAATKRRVKSEVNKEVTKNWEENVKK